MMNHGIHWFWFLIDPTIVATNYRAEQALRPAVVNRKVWGGNRTWLGAQAQGILMSVIRTCEQRASDPFAFLIDVLCRPRPLLLLA
jgi:transposase